jgi:ectoine hydroxylase-related dioxygenase (phytanoyl-CoA dioxygenase family)
MIDQSLISVEELDRNGYSLLSSVMREELIAQLLDSIAEAFAKDSADTTKTAKHSLRHLLRTSDVVRKIANSHPALSIAENVLGPGALPVRALLLDKTEEANWYVVWHQDVTIAVTERLEIQGFGPWTIKDGIVHVQPPINILEKMVALRIHLDPCPSDNGAIRFIPGSHKAGLLRHEQINSWKESQPAVCCPAEQGDVIVMRPLILHSSSPSQKPGHRRVLHIEYANAQLPIGLDWAVA